ncbi:MAG: DUF6784 domain-containing protein [Candidatus Poribacteria bacterium]|uniref:DUF6784 domain-containing protein n=1 Tax=marine metagenome TaxID=408172 RepID=A0A382FU40_9ZZZZ|nr:DUF6784 domain-containing protein [Candidatus Poribacteria bacterium]
MANIKVNKEATWRSILIGLILGDFVVGSLWMVFGMLTQQHVYMIFI